MKNKILFALLIALAVWTTASAQSIPNYSFENWSLDTNYLSLTLTSPATLDTTISSDPTGWTTSNDISNGAVFGHKTLVTQSATAHIGSSAIQLRTDSLHAVLTGVPGLGTYPVNFVCPGFAVCGRFPINLSAFVNIGGTFNPALLGGAGIPVSGRYSQIGGYLQYTPVGNDTAYVIAVLRQGSTVVAQATYKHYSTDAGYVFFEAPFVYQNCLAPDTMVYTISSGNPYSISGVALGGSSGLHMGSTLLADSIFLADTITGFYALEPVAVNDSAHTTENTAVSIPVLSNDISCESLIIDSLFQPIHGTIAISGDSIVYTPATNFTGMDSFYYNETSGSSPASNHGKATVRVIPYPAGIMSVADSKTTIYPNPASTKLYVSSSNPSISELKIFDMLGKVMKEESFSSNAAVDLSGFSNGLYIAQFSGNDGKVVSSSRFTVIK